MIFIFLSCLLTFVSEVLSNIPSFVQFFFLRAGAGGSRGRWFEPDHFKHQRKKWIAFIRDSFAGGNVLGKFVLMKILMFVYLKIWDLCTWLLQALGMLAYVCMYVCMYVHFPRV